MNESKHPAKYIGEKDLNCFFDFLDKYSSMKNAPMPKDKISVIVKNIHKENTIPDQYLKFLQRAGLQFGQWDGCDILW